MFSNNIAKKHGFERTSRKRVSFVKQNDCRQYDKLIIIKNSDNTYDISIYKNTIPTWHCPDLFLSDWVLETIAENIQLTNDNFEIELSKLNCL